MDILSKRIKQLRIEKNVTLIQLAKDTNISKSALNNYELGLQIPSAQVIVILAKYFNVSSDYLLGLKDY